MDVILLERVEKLGGIGDVVKVKDGFARNFLLPRKKALRANEANRKVHAALEPTQEQKNQMLMDAYGERSSLEDMERAIAGMEAKVTTQKDRNRILEEAYGDKASLADLQRAMEIYEVQ